MLRIAFLIVLAACGSTEMSTREPVAARDGTVAIDPEPAKPAVPAKPVAPGRRLPDGATPIAYDLRLELDPDSEAFRGRVEIRVQLARATDHVWLHASKIEFGKAEFRAGARTGALVDLKPTVDNKQDAMRGWSFDAPLPAGEVTLAFEYTGKVTRNDNEGLFRQQVGGRWYLFAQSESIFARRITPCFDEPRWKPTWRVTLVVPEKQQAFANGAVIEERKLVGKREIRFAEITKMPSYLLSVAVGPFAVVDAGKVGRANVPARVIVPAGNQGNVGVVKLKLPLVVDALEKYLDRPLPLAKLDLVAIPKFFGAMENTGLVTFEDSILVGDPKKWYVPRRFIRFAAHELAHQWFGNAVTPAWWDDLWISEGFATWLGEKISEQLGAYTDPSLRRQLGRLHALEADDHDKPRPLRRPIDDEEVESRFDAIAYQKGGALLEMLERFVGEDTFRDAIRRYLTKHDGGNATSRDVVAAIATASPDAAVVLESYLDMAGAPAVTLSLDCAAGKIEVRAATGTVPVCVKIPGADTKTSTRACVAATPSRGAIAIASCPVWVIGNADGSGYYHIADPALAKAAPMTTSERLAYAHDIGAAVVRGDITLAVALQEIRAQLGRDPVGRLGAAIIAAALHSLVDDALRPVWTRWLATRFNVTAATIYKNTGTAVQSEFAERLGPLLAVQAGTKVGFEKIIARAKSSPEDGQADILDNLGYYGSDYAPTVVELWLGGTFKPAKVWPAVAILLERPSTRTAAWRAIRDRAPKVLSTIAEGEIDKLIEATARFCDATFRTEVVAAFTPVRDSTTKLAKPLASIDRCIARRAKLGDLATAMKAS